MVYRTMSGSGPENPRFGESGTARSAWGNVSIVAKTGRSVLASAVIELKDRPKLSSGPAQRTDLLQLLDGERQRLSDRVCWYHPNSHERLRIEGQLQMINKLIFLAGQPE